MATISQIQQLYIAYFGRPADPAGLDYWVSTGISTKDFAAAMYAQPEFQQVNAGLPVIDQVNALYLNLFGRSGDTEGLLYWTQQINTGKLSLASIANDLIFAANNNPSAQSQLDKTALNNKTATAIAYTGDVRETSASLIAYNPTSSTPWVTGPQFTSAVTYLAGVTQTAPTAAATQASVDAMTAIVAPGQTFTLTTNIDTFTGTANADTFVSSLVFDVSEASTASSTLNIADTIVGGSGADLLTITISGAQDATVAITAAGITGVETFNVRNTVLQTATLAATNFAGLTAANSDRSVGALTVTGLTASASGGIIGDGVLTNGASTFGWGSSVLAGTVNISGGTLGAGVVTTSGTLLATNTVNSTGASNTIGALTLGAAVTTLNINATTNLTTGAVSNTTAAALTRINVTGSGTVNISAAALQATVATIDASAATGALTVALGSLATQKVTGGSGNDVISTGGVLTTGSVDAGAGNGDVLVVTAVANVNTTTLAAKYTNFETLRIGALALDMSLISGITAVQLTGAATLTNMSATQAAAVTARANIGNASLALANAAGTSDVLTITNGLGTKAEVATSIGTLVATGFETINLVANPGISAAVGADRTTTVTAITDTSLTAVNLTGTAFTFGDIASTKAVAWNASALTGNGAATPVGLTLTTTGAAFAGSVVTGSALRDGVVMTTSTGVTFNLGAGNDTFSTTSALLLPSGASTDNTINAGEGTSDQLIITGAATLTDTSFTKTSGFESLQLAGGAVNNSVTGLGAGFLGAYATGVTVTDAATQATAQTYTWASGLYSQNVTLTHVTDAVGVANTANQSITTGAGNDTITLTAASFTALTAGVSQGQIVVSTGAGTDSITVSTGTLNTAATAQAVSITGGTGADAINITSHVNGAATTTLLGNISIVVAAGDSSTTAFDSITGFRAGATSAGEVSDMLDFSNATLNAYTATAVAGYTAAQLTVAVSAAGLTTFAGTSAASLTLAEKVSAVQSVVITVNGDSAFFIDNGNTYVFNNETAGDVLVQLTGLTGVTALITTNAATANAVFIG